MRRMEILRMAGKFWCEPGRRRSSSKPIRSATLLWTGERPTRSRREGGLRQTPATLIADVRSARQRVNTS